MKIIRFNDALRNAALIAQSPELPQNRPIGLVRDVYGRIRFAIDCAMDEYPQEARRYLEKGLATLGAYATKTVVMFRDDFNDPDAIFANPDWRATTIDIDTEDESRPIETRVLDRQIIGQDWLKTETSCPPHPTRIVFYGIKGGVGRSTALTMIAHGLARTGKRVLLIDFDLESPGLSGLLLPPERVAEFGLVDWFVEDAVGQGESILHDMVSDSPLADTTSGAIRVVAAMGQGEKAYLSKLARIYADIPRRTGLERFASRMQRILALLEAQEKPDAVLIDSRAGLHDVAAVSIASLADIALLFATDTTQNWLGYRQLFTHWQHHRKVCAQVRERLAIVQALAPKSDRESRHKSFLNNSYDLFSSTLYDEIAPPSKANDSSTDTTTVHEMNDFYNPPMEDEAAPHFPIRVDWDEVFQEFDPRVRSEHGGVSDAEIDAKFGALIAWVKARISGE